MRIKNIQLKNIGPFDEGVINFISGEDDIHKPPVTIITGENGTGKTIVLDAIRGVLLGNSKRIERDIVRDSSDFLIEADLFLSQISKSLETSYSLINIFSNFVEVNGEKGFKTNQKAFNDNFGVIGHINSWIENSWIANYWTSKLASDSFNLINLVAPKPENYLINSLNGIQPNIEVTQLICFFDYLKSSDNPKEKKQGEFLFNLLKKIIKLSLIDGEFKYVERRTLTPIIYQTGMELSLDKLSSGNLYLIQRMVSLLGQMYSVHILNNTNIEELCNTPGLLLIDEAENHLHPKWQKTFLNSILDIFPNLQIIVTTHSPFIVSSVKNARIYVCRSEKDHSVIEDKTDEYSNKPIEEILLSPVFSTNSFNAEISELIQKRKQFINENKKKEAKEIEQKLLAINPEYFSYFNVEDLLKSISK